MLISQAFPSKYLRAADLGDKEHTLEIADCVMEAIDEKTGEQKPILYFKGAQKGLVLNVTNANMISHLYGDDTTRWPGNSLVLFSMMTSFQGKPVQGLRVRGPAGAPMANTPVAAPEGPASLDDEIPF